MRRLIVVLVLVVVFAGAYRHYGSPTTGTGTLTLPPPAPAPGDDAPAFSADRVGQRGAFVLSGQGTYVVAFWSRLSLNSERSEPHLRRLAEDFGGENVRFAASYINGPPEVAGTRPYAVLRDGNGRLASLYNAKRVPRLFVVKDGTVRLTHDGFPPEGYAEVRETLEELGPPPS